MERGDWKETIGLVRKVSMMNMMMIWKWKMNWIWEYSLQKTLQTLEEMLLVFPLHVCNFKKVKKRIMKEYCIIRMYIQRNRWIFYCVFAQNLKSWRFEVKWKQYLFMKLKTMNVNIHFNNIIFMYIKWYILHLFYSFFIQVTFYLHVTSIPQKEGIGNNALNENERIFYLKLFISW